MAVEKEAGLFKLLADATRLRLVVLLAEQGETCVCKLAKALHLPEYSISRHLGILRAAGFVVSRREKTWMHYRLREPQTELEACLHNCFRDCLRNHPVARADLEQLCLALCPSADVDAVDQGARQEAVK